MSIVQLVKITAYGHRNRKEKTLEGMQQMGNLHLIPLNSQTDSVNSRGPSPQLRETLKFLLDCPQRRRQVRNPEKFDAADIEMRALKLKNQILVLEDERDFLRKRIQNLKPWGEFVFPSARDLNNQRFWFYIVPHYKLPKVEQTDLKWQIVHKDNRFFYIVVLSENQPSGMPVVRTATGKIPLSKLVERLDEVEIELEDLHLARVSLTRWCDLFAGNLRRLEDQEELVKATQQTYDQSPLFALQAWAPRKDIADLKGFAVKNQLALVVEEPRVDDIPPTLLHNPPVFSGGQDLVSFYTTPSYWGWDPSITVFISFTVFFAMILSDAGYALLLGIGLIASWRQMGRSDLGQRLRILFFSMVTISFIWGAFVGSYFGMQPQEGSVFAAMNLLDLNDSETMMRLSILIGVSHVILANFVDAWRLGRSTAAIAPIGWAVIILGATTLWIGTSGYGPAGSLKSTGIGAMGVGAVAILLFSATSCTYGKRLLIGLQALYKVTNAFGDILSYLRLFALGLASASLALAFNELAAQISADVPGFGTLLAFVVLIVGHALNLTLAIMSGFVHGLRLNFIEFFNWGLSDEGKPFRPFSKKENYIWN